MPVSSSIFIIPDSSKKDDGTSPVVSFDAVKTFSAKRSKSLSQSPISDGSFVSEILTENPGLVTMEAYAAANPIVLNQYNLIDTADADIRTQAAYYALDAIYKANSTVQLVHKYDALDSYFLKSFEPIIMPMDVIGFKLTFEEVRFATEERVTLTLNMSDDLAKGAATEQVSGETSKTTATEDEGFMTVRVLDETGKKLLGIEE